MYSGLSYKVTETDTLKTSQSGDFRKLASGENSFLHCDMKVPLKFYDLWLACYVSHVFDKLTGSF